MNLYLIANDKEIMRRQQIADSLITNLEEFRTDAARAYAEYLPYERSIISNLKTDKIDAYTVLEDWEETLKPLLEAINDKRSDANFRKIITEQLLLVDTETQVKINSLVIDRKFELINNFISKFYPVNKKAKNRYRQQRQQIRELLSMPASKIQSVKNHYVCYLLYKEATERNNITAIDSHTSLIKRLVAKRHIRHERKQTIKSENSRLSYINDRIKSLSAMNSGLLVDISNKKWDFVAILDLRHNYEKKISKLTKENEKDAVKRLSIFDAVTADFKKSQIEKMTIDSDISNLETTRTITKDIDSILLRIFDLSNIQKNQLLVCFKEYRELGQEKTSILDRQSIRRLL